MKQRVLVMNGQRLLQNEISRTWIVAKVDKAGALRPGIYNIHSASEVNRKEKSAGLILHLDAKSIYQEVGKSIVKHAISYFEKIPSIGSDVIISYSDNKAVVEDEMGIRNSHHIRR